LFKNKRFIPKIIGSGFYIPHALFAPIGISLPAGNQISVVFLLFSPKVPVPGVWQCQPPANG
jgi:hypothetical protein